MVRSFFIFVFALAGRVAADLTSDSLEKHVGTLNLDSSFKPVKPAYWTGYPHHRRTPFALSPDGSTAYLAYLDASETGVHVQQVDPTTFAATGTSVTIAPGKEAGGLVAHNDGFALLANEALPSGTTDAPPGNTLVPVLYRYANGQQSWKTFLGGPGVHASDGLSASPDLNGDLAFSEAAQLYRAYFVVTDYAGWAAGHFGDSVQYVSPDGTRKDIAGASSSWGCSHNTGIAFEAADAPPYASICAEDHGAIWLNTITRSMDGVKISNENVQNGASNEPMGGMSGSYSSLARFINSGSYIFAWVSRGAKDLTQDTWRGGKYTQAANRTVARNVAIATFSDTNTLDGPQAISVIGAASGDDQVNWITQGSADTSNAHVAAFDASNALVTWEEASNPSYPFIAMGCAGTFSGTFFQQVDNKGAKKGSPISSTDTYVAGDMVNFPNGKICWPYIDMKWSLAARSDTSATATKMSFACMNIGAASTTPSNGTASSASPSTTLKTSTVSSSAMSIPATSTKTPESSISFSTSVSSAIAVVSTSRSLAPESSPSTSSTSIPSVPQKEETSAAAPTLAPSSVAPTTTALTTTQPAATSTASALSSQSPFEMKCYPIKGKRGGIRWKCSKG